MEGLVLTVRCEGDARFADGDVEWGLPVDAPSLTVGLEGVHDAALEEACSQDGWGGIPRGLPVDAPSLTVGLEGVHDAALDEACSQDGWGGIPRLSRTDSCCCRTASWVKLASGLEAMLACGSVELILIMSFVLIVLTGPGHWWISPDNRRQNVMMSLQALTDREDVLVLRRSRLELLM